MGQDNGGWYYQPEFGFDATSHYGFNVSYMEVNFQDNFSAVVLGIEYSF